MKSSAWLALLFLVLAAPLYAQDNYEIQVYGAETVAKGATMVELHSNYTPDGLPLDDHRAHETLEITHGISDWFETGFYIFTDAGGGDGWQFVGLTSSLNCNTDGSIIAFFC